jgi:hypothetical protein
MKTRIFLVVVAVVVLMASSAVTVSADDDTMLFRARYTTWPQLVPPPGPVLQFAIKAEGWATYLGRSDWYADMWVDSTSNPNPQWGDMTFTAANGDQLFGTYKGFSTPPETGVKFWGRFEITEGTGRFEGATARGVYWGSCGAEEGKLNFLGMMTTGDD